MTHGTHGIALRELDHRSHDGIDVTLLWDSVANQVLVAAHDSRIDETLEFKVAPADALLAFHHPYAFAYSSPDQLDLVHHDDPCSGA